MLQLIFAIMLGMTTPAVPDVTLDITSLSNPDVTMSIDSGGELTARDTCHTITGTVDMNNNTYTPRDVTATPIDNAVCDTQYIRTMSAITATDITYTVTRQGDGTVGISATEGATWSFAGEGTLVK